MKKLIFIIAFLPIFAFGQTYNLDSETPNLTSVNVKTYKAHITSKVDATANAWVNFSNFTAIQSESLGDLGEFINDTSFKVNETGLYQFGGCIHYKDNLGGGFDELTILTRIFVNGTDEARCSQRGKTQSLRGDGEDVLSYNGTVFLNDGDVISLQYYTNTADLDFFSSDEFENPVAATIWLIYQGR